MASSRKKTHTKAHKKILSLSELCEGIDDKEKELAAAWELAREVRGRLRGMTNRNKRGRKFQAIRTIAMGKESILDGKLNYWFHEHFNSWALTFTKSKKWPNKAYKDLRDEEKWEAFPRAPVFQKEYLKAFGSPSLVSAAEMLTPSGKFKHPWNPSLLGQLFKPAGSGPDVSRPVTTNYRLIKIDSSFSFEQIRSEILSILKDHCYHQRSKGGNHYATWLRNLALYRAQKSGWGISEMEKCWERARAIQKTEKTDLTQRSKYGYPPKEKIQKRIDSIKKLLEDIF
jgi:hypothetical protein